MGCTAIGTGEQVLPGGIIARVRVRIEIVAGNIDLTEADLRAFAQQTLDAKIPLQVAEEACDRVQEMHRRATLPPHVLSIWRGQAVFCGRCGQMNPTGYCDDATDDQAELRDRIEWQITREVDRADGARGGRKWRDRVRVRDAALAAEGQRQLVSEAIRPVVGGWNRR